MTDYKYALAVILRDALIQEEAGDTQVREVSMESLQAAAEAVVKQWYWTEAAKDLDKAEVEK